MNKVLRVKNAESGMCNIQALLLQERQSSEVVNNFVRHESHTLSLCPKDRIDRIDRTYRTNHSRGPASVIASVITSFGSVLTASVFVTSFELDTPHGNPDSLTLLV